MDISKAVRNPQRVHASLLEKDNQLITKTGCTIYIPERYISKGLAVIGTEISILGIYAMFIDDVTYGVSTATAMCTLGDLHISDKVTIEDVDYLSYKFPAGAVVLKTVELVIVKKIVNAIMDFFVDYGYTPWFFNYVDLAELFFDTGYWNKMDMGGQIVQDIITANISRDPKDITKLFKDTMSNIKQLDTRPTFIPQRDIGMNTSSNLARVNGSELARATRAMLLSEPTQPQELEDILMN